MTLLLQIVRDYCHEDKFYIYVCFSLCLFVSLCACLFVCLPISLSAYPSIYIYMLSVCLNVYMPAYISGYLSVRLLVRVAVRLSVCQCDYNYVCQRICLCLGIYVFLSFCPYVIHLSACLSGHLLDYIYVCLLIFWSVCLSLCLLVCLSVFISQCCQLSSYKFCGRHPNYFVFVV